MRYTAIPNTTLIPSALCMGTTMIGSVNDKQMSFRLLDAFLDAGGTFVDTAKVYADWLPGERSVSEKMIGEWLRHGGKRSQVVLATKGAHPELATMHIGRLARAEIVADLEASLHHLQTDVIDLYWLHRDDVKRPVAEILETLENQVRAGKIRYYGCSNWRMDRVNEAQTFAHSQGWTGFVADQMMWSLAAIDVEALPDKTGVAMDVGLMHYHLASGMAAVPYSAQANGYFQRVAAGEQQKIKAEHRRIYDNRTNEQRLERIRRLSSETGLSITAIVLGYLMSQPFPTLPIFACRTPEQLEDTLQAANVTLTEGEVTYLERGD
jgi:aryl-alcohol dehydrogenase-like predicted oxidoreductase